MFVGLHLFTSMKIISEMEEAVKKGAKVFVNFRS